MDTPLTQNIKPDREPLDITEYERAGGYQALRKAIQMSPREIQQMVIDSNLRGRGGAGFPTGKKWSYVPMGEEARHPKFLIMNADEMEPGTFKDRLLLEGDPNLIVESMIISAYAIEADVAYIFLRWAYRLAAQRVTKAIAQAYEKGYLGKNILGSPYSLDLYLHTSAGRYMCGEEDGLLDAPPGQAGHPADQAAPFGHLRALGQAHRRQQRGDARKRSPHHQQWPGVVPQSQSHGRRRNEALRGQRQGQEKGHLGAAHGDDPGGDLPRLRRRHDGGV